MRINSIPSKDLYLQYVNSARDVQPVTARPSMGTDKVELTDSAKTFSSVLRAAKATAMDEASSVAKTDAIRQRIANNDYNISGAAVAEKILGF